VEYVQKDYISHLPKNINDKACKFLIKMGKYRGIWGVYPHLMCSYAHSIFKVRLWRTTCYVWPEFQT